MLNGRVTGARPVFVQGGCRIDQGMILKLEECLQDGIRGEEEG
jgi:hypothetical protein